MTNLPFLFAAAVALAASLASIAIWAPRRLGMKLAALACAAGFMPMAWAGYSDLLSRPKPVTLEWWQAAAGEATVLGSQLREGDSLYLWLALPNAPEPRAYRLPWDQKLAEQLQRALEQAARNGTETRMRLPFEPTLDAREPKFYAAPQPALPPKDYAQPPAEIYVQPGENA